ncbi:MAG: aldo/keto reductase [Promicromonosporaceae bacterium]|nr:aldo/keto reductase [Promicromonosporaceae bacterium]
MSTTEPASALVLGAMMFGTAVDEATSFAVLDRFVERGGEWIDTANAYAFWASADGRGGDSERLLGRWFAARPGVRDRVKIATKVGADTSSAGSVPPQREGLSPRAVRDGFAASLDRLGIPSVDLLWIHMEDRATPIEETVEALAAVTGSGLAGRIGASNHPAWRVERARAHARQIGSTPIDVLQHNSTYLRPRPGTNPTNHRFGVLSDELRDYAAVDGLEVWAYTPLLSGAYDNPAKPIPEMYDHPGNAARLAVLDEVAAELGATRGQTVLAWHVAHGVRPMLGGSKVEQLDSALDAVRLTLTPEQLERLDTPS